MKWLRQLIDALRPRNMGAPLVPVYGLRSAPISEPLDWPEIDTSLIPLKED